MRRFPKAKLDSLIDYAIEYWQGNGSFDKLDERNKVAIEVEKETDLNWLSVVDFIDAILRKRGFLPNATKEEIYKVLNLLGWEVYDET